MSIDNIDIFQKYLEVLEEGNYVFGRVKRKAGVARKTPSTRPKNIRRHSDKLKRRKLADDYENNKYYIIEDLLADLFKGGKEEALKKLEEYVPYKEGGNYLNERDLQAIETKDKPLKKYNITAFNLADKIEHTKSEINTSKNKDRKNFFMKLYSVLSKLHEDNFGKKAEDVELSDYERARSFKTKTVKEKDRKVLVPQIVGGASKLNPKTEYIPVTTREESPRLRREEEGGGKSFGFDIRQDDKDQPTEEEIRQDQLKRDRKEDFIYMQRLQNQGLSGEPLQDALRKYRADRAARRSGESTQPPTPKSKKKKLKESYEPFIKIIPF